MSGVYGVVEAKPVEWIAGMLEGMGKALSHHEWYVNERYTEPGGGVGLGRIGIGVFNRESQPVHSECGGMSLVFAGELTHRVALVSALGEAGVGVSEARDEELVLAAYKVWGEAALVRLEGQYVFALLDRGRGEVVLANDRFGLYPTYYWMDGIRLVFGPEVKSVLKHPAIKPELREDALAEYFRFQRLLGTKTYFVGVEMLPPATVLRYDVRTGKSKVRRYWELGEAKPSQVTVDEAVEEGARLFGSAIGEAVQGKWRTGVYLSGGLDSRMIAGMVAEQGRELQTFTFGQPGCRDEHYARQIATAVGAEHHFYPYHDGRWIEEFAPAHVRLAEGFHSWLHMHGINMLGDVRRHIDVNVSGLGDLIWPQQNFTPPHLLLAPDDIAFSSILFELYHQKYTWPGLTYPDEYNLYTEAWRPRLVGLAYESFLAELRAYSHLSFATRAAAFNLDNHFARYLIYHCVFGRSHVEYRLPYFDLSLLTFIYGLPVQLGVGRRIQKAIIARHLPDVARIPSADDELPIIENASSQRVARLMKEVRKQAARFIAPASATRSSLYADYEGWLRTDLRGWAESILFDQRTHDRGLFSREALMSLWSRHVRGDELWTVGKLASIITFEMTMRSLGI